MGGGGDNPAPRIVGMQRVYSQREPDACLLSYNLNFFSFSFEACAVGTDLVQFLHEIEREEGGGGEREGEGEEERQRQ